MKELARADGKVLRMGAYEYDTVILCHCESVMKSTQEILKKFGGRILVLGQSPRYCEYETDADVRVDMRYADVAEAVRDLRSRRVAETGGAPPERSTTMRLCANSSMRADAGAAPCHNADSSSALALLSLFPCRTFFGRISRKFRPRTGRLGPHSFWRASSWPSGRASFPP